MKTFAVTDEDVDETKENGECFRACIASLLDLELDQVPHFYEFAFKKADLAQAHLNIKKWFAKQHLYFIEIPIRGKIFTILERASRYNIDLPFMLSGISKNGRGHCVVCLNEKIVYNPYPPETIVAPFKGGDYYISFIGKLLNPNMEITNG